jgi:hypothetical protein
LTGYVGDRTIHAGSEDETIKNIAKSSPLAEKASTSILLWPDMKRRVGASVMLPLQGSLKAEMIIYGMEPLIIEFAYPKFTTSRVRRATLRMVKRIQARLRAKFPEASQGIEFMQTVRAETKDGTAVVLTVSVTGKQDEVELLDVEFLVPLNKLKSAPKKEYSADEKKVLEGVLDTLQKQDPTLQLSESSIYCDATNISHMTGLTMALEYAQAQIKAGIADATAFGGSNVAFENSAAIVRKHTRAMLDGKSFTESGVPMEVNAAVYTAVNALQEMQTVDGIFSSGSTDANKYLGKLSDAANTKTGDSAALNVATTAIAALKTKMDKARGSKLFSSLRKGALKKDLENWRSAIRRFSGQSTDRINLMKPAMDAIDEAESSLSL